MNKFDIPTLEPVISDLRQLFGNSLATNITSSRPQLGQRTFIEWALYDNLSSNVSYIMK
jgi:hypothetical protein